MPQEAWKCSACGEMYETKSRAEECERRHAEEFVYLEGSPDKRVTSYLQVVREAGRVYFFIDVKTKKPNAEGTLQKGRFATAKMSVGAKSVDQIKMLVEMLEGYVEEVEGGDGGG